MSFRVRARVKGRSGTKVVVEEGTIFEVADLSASSPQTLRVSSTREFVLESDDPMYFDVDTDCLNRSRPAPSNTSMRATPFVKP